MPEAALRQTKKKKGVQLKREKTVRTTTNNLRVGNLCKALVSPDELEQKIPLPLKKKLGGKEKKQPLHLLLTF